MRLPPHTTDPYWSGGNNNEDALLASCYRNSLTLAAQHNLHTIAFPAISTGIFRFPLERATNIALRETLAFLANNTTIEKVIFVCFDDRTFQTYHAVLHQMLSVVIPPV